MEEKTYGNHVDCKKRSDSSVKKLVGVAIFAAMGAILMYISFPIPLAPPFMKVDLADVPTLVSGFAFGPLAGVITVIIKNLIHLLIEGTTTAYVGEVSNIIVNASFVLLASFIYKNKKDKKHAIVGAIIGVIAMTIVATLSNYFFIFPLYAKVMFNGDINQFIPMVQSVNSAVTSYASLMAFAVAPFNIIKGGLNALITIFIYKSISSLIKKY